MALLAFFPLGKCLFGASKKGGITRFGGFDTAEKTEIFEGIWQRCLNFPDSCCDLLHNII